MRIKNFECYRIEKSSILAGMFIALGGIAFLKVSGAIGAILFSFGLLGCIHYRLSLYTGTAGFISNKKDFFKLINILIGNIIGCLLIACAIKLCYPELIQIANEIVSLRLSYNWIKLLFLSTFCGFIMTTVVKFARENRFLPLLFGIPLFILCGFIHSIADAFYVLMCPWMFIVGNIGVILLYYMIIVIGNFIGCNLSRIIMLEKYF